MKKQKVCFIVNPIAGKVKKKQLPTRIAELLDAKKYDYEIAYTEYGGHARVLAQDAVRRHFDIVVAAGGDGSINEIGSCLIGTPVTLAIIPCGSGNGLSHHLHIPLSASGAIEVINKGKKIKIDTVTVNDKPFISIAGVGFDAKVADDFSKDRHRGFDTYLKYILHELVLYQQESYEIEANGKSIEGKALFISFANSNEQGYNLPISPHADLQDGKVDICIIKKPNIFELPIVGGHLLARKMDQAPNVEIIQTNMAKIRRQKPGLVNIDGEPVMMEKDLNISVNPLSLNLIVNEK